MRWSPRLFLPFLAVVAVSCGGDADPVTPPAQQFGQVTGLVRDAAGAAVAAASISLTAAGQTSLSQVSGTDGRYTFSQVKTGTWTATVAPPTGFTIGAAGASKTVVVTANATATVDPLVLNRNAPVTPPATATVEMRSFAFSPQTVTIALNGTVTWTNFDTSQHNATGTGFTATGNFGQGVSRSASFAARGTFPYSCTLHSGMNGTVIVQ